MENASNRGGWLVLLTLAAFLLGGCQKEAITSYQVPKEDYTAKPLTRAGRGGEGPARDEALPRVQWELPKGWQEKPGESMSVAQFRIPGPDGKFAEVKIIPLPGVAGAPEIESQTVQMWNRELSLPEKNVAKPTDVEAAGLTAKLYDLTSAELKFEGKSKSRITAAMLPRESTLWFIKMSGEESVVASQQAPFRAFLKSLSFHEPERAEPSVAAADDGGDSLKGNWKIPSTWKEKTAGQMVLAAYSAQTANGAKADVPVSVFAGATGGLLGNVNRWRGQVSLPPIEDQDLGKNIKTTDLTDGSKGTTVYFKGTSAKTGGPASLYGLIVPRGAQTWFYKLLGDEEVVSAEAKHLDEFAASAH